ncbi:MAG: hypothetical protein IPM57_08710 [Oligoflexia bacterium]|nr:hypothetical protein [Oligoflexia bacterium]
MIIKNWGFLFFVICVSSLNSYGSEETSSPQVTQIETKTRFVDKLSVKYSNTFFGPSLTSPFSGTHFDSEEEGGKAPLELENSLQAGYKLNQDAILGVVTKWVWHPVPSENQPFMLLDPYLRLSHAKLLTKGNFNVAADLRVSAPVSEKSIAHGLITSVASEQETTYEIPESRFTIGLTTFVQVNFHNEVDHQEGDSLELHLSPKLEYKVSNSLALNMVYELTRTQPRFADVAVAQPEGSILEVGAVWDITNTLKFNPNIHTRTLQALSMDTLTLGAKLDWILL